MPRRSCRRSCCSAHFQHDAGDLVADRLGARDVGADEISLDHVARRGVTINPDADPAATANEVARAGGRAADRIVERAHEADVVAIIGKRGGAGGVDAEVVALDGVVRHAVEQDPAVFVGVVDAVVGNDVTRRGGRAADHVVRPRTDLHAAAAVARAGGPRGGKADVISGDGIIVPVDKNPAVAEVIDDEAKDGVAVPGEGDPLSPAASGGSVEGNEWLARVTRLRGGVDRDIPSQARQGRGRCDRLRPGTDAEIDRSAARRGISADDRLAQRAHAAVGRIRDGESGEQLSLFQLKYRESHPARSARSPRLGILNALQGPASMRPTAHWRMLTYTREAPDGSFQWRTGLFRQCSPNQAGTAP